MYDYYCFLFQVAWFIPMLVAAIAYYQFDQTDPEGRPADIPNSRLLLEYDFIIVGAGSAGYYNFIMLF